MTLRVLYVDDDADIREIVALSLSLDPDFAVETAVSGADALVRARRGGIDLILLDVMMPVMDGRTTFAELRALGLDPPIPVAFVTARTQAHEIALFKGLGAIGVIAKPFDPMTLARDVKALCAS
ncbi:response regulator [Aquabacter spiritensis]|uniref:Response regulator receiver domain-containing protein n=1 Tax=Aquabacter spiritensis TaxID=933073 RepID=A0A4R3LTV4_9HYPH|nr:response regulator [Aquabacter spiritensis]TCT03934.1 response regulator receiver domain-containing protein [Aquabacter spiritensis]